MEPDSIMRWMSIYLIVHYSIVAYCIYDMFSKHKMKTKWRFFWIPFILLFSIAIIFYFIFRKDLQIQQHERVNS